MFIRIIFILLCCLLLDFIGFVPSGSYQLAIIDPISATIMGGVGLLGSLFGGIFGSSSQNKANQTNLRIARETNANQMAMAREQNQMIHDEAELAWEREKEMFGMENAYNDPKAILERQLNAGINPYVAMSGSLGSSMATSASGGSAPMASGFQLPSLVTPQVQAVPNVFNGAIENIGSLAKAFTDVQSGKLSEAQKISITARLDKELTNLDLQNAHQQFDNWLQQTFGKEKASRENQLLAANIVKAVNEAFLAADQGQVAKKQLDVMQSTIDKMVEEKELTHQQAEYWKKEVANYDKILNSNLAVNSAKIRESNSAAANNMASADNQRAQAGEHRATTEGINKHNDWIDDQEAADVVEKESRTYKNYQDGFSGSNPIEVGQRNVRHTQNSDKAKDDRRDRIDAKNIYRYRQKPRKK